jgi:hypothetical protein
MSLMDFVVSPPGCGRSVTDFWGWDAHKAQLRCPDEVDSDTWIWSTSRGLNLSSTKLPRPWSPWESSPSRKNPHGRTGIFLMYFIVLFWTYLHTIEPGTSWSVARNSDHKTKRLVSSQILQVKYRADKRSIRQFSITVLPQIPRNKKSRILSRVPVRSQNPPHWPPIWFPHGQWIFFLVDRQP